MISVSIESCSGGPSCEVWRPAVEKIGPLLLRSLRSPISHYDNDYVSSSKYEGDMDIDWGGQGPATMPSGNSCYGLGTDKCAQITGSGNSTSTMGVSYKIKLPKNI